MKTYKLITAGLIGITACSGAVLGSLGTYADGDSATDTTTVTIPVSCMMSGTVDAPHSAELAPGTYSGATGTIYENGIGKTTLTTYCNDYNGFSIYAIGFTGNTEGDNTLKGTSASGNATIATKAYESTDTTSNWSMKVTKVTDSTVSYNPSNMTITTGYDTFHAIPDDYTKVAEYKASTGSSGTDTGTNALGAKVETTYAAYIAPTQAADTYTGQVKYVMVHPYDHTAPVKPEAPLSQCPTPLSNEVSGINYMQDINSSNIATVLAAINAEDQYFLRDSRDDQPYCVSKLKDGRLWMTENLNLAGGTALSATDTDVTSAYISSFSTSNNLTKADDTIVLPTSTASGFNTDDYSFVYNTGNKTNNCSNPGCFSYYSWDAATLGSGRTTGTYDTDVAQSICPKNWRLPTTRTADTTGWQANSDLYNLAHQYGLDSTTSAYESDNGFYTQAGPGTAPNFLFTGFYGGSSLHDGGLHGYYWSSTFSPSNTRAFSLFFESDTVNTIAETIRRTGYGVRCLIGS